MTLYAMREKMAELGQQITVEAEFIAKSAGDPAVSMETIQERKKPI